MENRLNRLYKYNMDEWNEGMEKHFLFPTLYCGIGVFMMGWSAIALIQKYGIKNPLPILGIATSCLCAFATTSLFFTQQRKRNTIHRFFKLPNKLPNSQVVVAIEKALNENNIDYKTKGDGKKLIKLPIFDSFTQIFEISGGNHFIRVSKQFHSNSYQVSIGEITEKNRHNLNSIKEIVEEYVNRAEGKYFESKFLKVLHNNDDKSLISSIYFLGQLESGKAVPKLCNILENTKDNITKGIIIQAFGKIGDKSTLPLLREYSGDLTIALREDDENVSLGLLAQEAIEKIERKHGEK